eukprot:10203139-Karenia_brevis.AAC.1
MDARKRQAIANTPTHRTCNMPYSHPRSWPGAPRLTAPSPSYASHKDYVRRGIAGYDESTIDGLLEVYTGVTLSQPQEVPQ